MNNRTYYVGVNLETQRLMVVINAPLNDIPFAVWRDVGRLAGCSMSTPTNEVFDFLCNNPKDVERAERILQGALFKRQ